MRKIGFVIVALAGVALAVRLRSEGDMRAKGSAAAPVLVELFTSEGCSSCPPADAFLQHLDGQPYSGVQLIVLSEHVDYWNHIGWTDPYSSAAYSERQSAYGNRFHLDSVYTPQMVVDGTDEFVGNSSGEARKFISREASMEKIPVRLSNVMVQDGMLRAHVDAGASGKGTAGVFLVVALDRAESAVVRGENAGRRLNHVAVVRSLLKVGSVDAGKSFAQDVSLKLPPGTDGQALRVVAFVQEAGPGRVLGAALENPEEVTLSHRLACCADLHLPIALLQ